MEMVVLLKKQLWLLKRTNKFQIILITKKTLKNLLKRMLIVKKKTLKHMMNIMTMKKQIMHM